MNVLAYSALAVFLIALVAVLVRRSPPPIGPAEPRPDYSGGVLNGSSLALASRLFDSSDFVWLRDAIGFPQLARELERRRRRLALCWIEDLRREFLEHVRTPDPQFLLTDSPRRKRARLGAILRIHLLLAYAHFVIRFFGPYHRLVPPFGWLEALTPRPAPDRTSARVNLSS
jgi:hypothetical protein